MLRRYPMTSLLVLIIAYPVFLSTGTTFGVEEYCERESFEASCAAGEVILIRSAIFGRMSLGRCVENGYGNLGCSVDVMAEVESQCSGRQRCQFPVWNLHGTRPCPSELISFLQASYDCVKVTTCSEHTCASGNSIKVTNSEGYLASLVTSSAGCGSDLCPWVLEALPGQRFNLTFRSFVRVQANSKQQLGGGRFCQRLATIFERASQVSKDVTLCDNDVSVVRIMTSAHEEVKLKLYYGTQENPTHFVVHYQVVGCADLEAPDGGWVKRTADSATVGCHGRPTIWHLTCNGVTWTGDVGRCRNPTGSQDVTPNWSVQAAMEKAGATTEGILLVVGLGVIIGVVVGCCMLSVVIVIIKRRRRKQAVQYERRLELLTQYSPGVSSDTAGKTYDPKSNACDFAQVGQSLMYDSGFGVYEAHGYTSTRPSCAASNLIEAQNDGTSCGSKIPEMTNCAIHGDHMYESHNFST